MFICGYAVKNNWDKSVALFKVLLLYLRRTCATDGALPTSTLVAAEEPPEGYYAFVESPNAEPPRVRPPPYSHAPVDCREDQDRTPHVSPFNLCGDLNKGSIPRNPMGQNVLGAPYPL